ncbi:MAG TPA: DUF302 domain-containing protein [Acidimicrobiales bacterium]|nr:DUF302 domain-containing protein [Acidimicrobiales bacterium]
MAATAGVGGAGAITKLSGRSVADTVTRLLALLEAKGLEVFDVIDQRAEAHAVGLDLRATTLVVFGSPAAGTPVMAAVPLSALDLPLKLLVWADDEGGTQVSYTDPAVLAERYGLAPELAAAFEGIHALSDALVAD